LVGTHPGELFDGRQCKSFGGVVQTSGVAANRGLTFAVSHVRLPICDEALARSRGRGFSTEHSRPQGPGVSGLSDLRDPQQRRDPVGRFCEKRAAYGGDSKNRAATTVLRTAARPGRPNENESTTVTRPRQDRASGPRIWAPRGRPSRHRGDSQAAARTHIDDDGRFRGVRGTPDLEIGPQQWRSPGVPAALGRTLAAHLDHEAPDAGVPGREAELINQVLPDRHGVAAPAEGQLDQLAYSSGTGGRRPAWGCGGPVGSPAGVGNPRQGRWTSHWPELPGRWTHLWSVRWRPPGSYSEDVDQNPFSRYVGNVTPGRHGVGGLCVPRIRGPVPGSPQPRHRTRRTEVGARARVDAHDPGGMGPPGDSLTAGLQAKRGVTRCSRR
jgi:hypothetical protein